MRLFQSLAVLWLFLAVVSATGANPFIPWLTYLSILPTPNPAIVGEPNSIEVIVGNNGEMPATTVAVQLAKNDWGVTFYGWTPIGTNVIPYIPGQTPGFPTPLESTTFSHTFTDRAHTCIQASILSADNDTTTNDNVGQINMEVINAGENFTYWVPITNRGNDTIDILSLALECQQAYFGNQGADGFGKEEPGIFGFRDHKAKRGLKSVTQLKEGHDESLRQNRAACLDPADPTAACEGAMNPGTCQGGEHGKVPFRRSEVEARRVAHEKRVKSRSQKEVPMHVLKAREALKHGKDKKLVKGQKFGVRSTNPVLDCSGSERYQALDFTTDVVNMPPLPLSLAPGETYFLEVNVNFPASNSTVYPEDYMVFQLTAASADMVNNIRMLVIYQDIESLVNCIKQRALSCIGVIDVSFLATIVCDVDPYVKTPLEMLDITAQTFYAADAVVMSSGDPAKDCNEDIIHDTVDLARLIATTYNCEVDDIQEGDLQRIAGDYSSAIASYTRACQTNLER